MKKFYLFLSLILLSVAANAQEVLTNQSIVAMNQAKVSRNLIVEKINISRCQFDLSSTGLLGLKSVDVPESVMETMLAVTRPVDVLTNEDVIQLYQGGLSRKLITQKIQAGPSRFNVNTDGVIQLKTAKVPEPIIKVMMTGGSPSGPKPAAKTPAKVSQSNSPPATVPERPAATAVAKTKVSVSDCTTWYDKFTKATVKASRVTLRGWKLGASLMNGVVGRGSANAVGIEDMEVDLIFRRDGNNLTLVLYATKPDAHTMFVSRDKPLMFLMQDESVMEFLPAEDSESDFSWGSGYSMESRMLMYYQLSPEQARTLTQKSIKEYRLNFYNRKFAQDTVNEGRAGQVRSAAQCVVMN